MVWLHILALILPLLIVSADDKKTSKTIILPTLGRPFGLGDLYNLKDDQIIIGPKLWTMDHLANYTQKIQRKTKFDIAASENIEDKENLFNIEAGLKLSFLGGLIEVSGSAAYLDDRVSTSNIARVSLKFDSRTFSRELKPNLFMHLDYPNVLEKVDATHVVVGIEYGASAVFVFDRQVSTYETKRKVKGEMDVAIRNLPSIEIEAWAKLEMNSAQKKNTQKFKCRFHGDFVLDKHPGTYDEAIGVYKELPKMLGKNYENSVPMSVWLYPIDALPIDKASEILHDIKNSLIHEVTVQIERLNEFQRDCNDILASGVAGYHDRIKIHVEAFKAGIQLYTVLFKQNLAKLLPQIRSNGKTSLLSELLASKESSTFSDRSLTSWTDDAKEEVIVLQTTQSLPHFCRHDGDFTALLLNEKRYTFALTMRLDVLRDNFIKDMLEYLDSAVKISASPNYKPYLGKANKWWTDNDLISELQRKKSSFENFYNIEKEKQDKRQNSDIQFLAREAKLDKGNRRVTIELYEYAKLIVTDYEIPSAPGTPSKTVTSFDSIDIMWGEPASGGDNVLYYEIDVYQLEDNSSDSVTKVKTEQTDKKIEKMLVTGLKPEKTYYFIVSVFSVLGKTAVSKQSNFMHTRPCPGGTYQTKDRCVSCDPGFYSKTKGVNSCLKCPVGSYSDSFSSKECKKCPYRTTTITSGARGKDECGKDLKGKIASEMASAIKKKFGSFEETVKQLRDEDTNLHSKIASEIASAIEKKSQSFERNVKQLRDEDKELTEGDKILQAQIYEIETRMTKSFNFFHPGKMVRGMVLVQNHDFRVDSAFKNKKWEAYAKGFGLPYSSEFWIGLRKLHSITQTGRWNVVFQIVYDKNRGGSLDPKAGEIGQFEMKDFKVASEADNFRLSMGNAVEAVNMRYSRSRINRWYKNYMNGRQFSTTDRGSNKACATRGGGGGWWFTGCSAICLNCHRSASSYYTLYDGNYRLPAISSIWLKRI